MVLHAEQACSVGWAALHGCHVCGYGNRNALPESASCCQHCAHSLAHVGLCPHGLQCMGVEDGLSWAVLLTCTCAACEAWLDGRR